MVLHDDFLVEHIPNDSFCLIGHQRKQYGTLDSIRNMVLRIRNFEFYFS